VNGTRLHYERSGSGPTLLFLHGFTLDRRMWARQVGALSPRFSTITYDARGFGRSSMPGGAPYRHFEDAAALCDHLGVKKVVAIGHSIGAHQMLELALARPDLVVGLVSVCMSGLAGIPFPDDVTKMFGEIRSAARSQSVDEAKRIWAKAGWFASAREDPTIARELDRMLDDYSGWHWTNDNPVRNLEPSAAERLESLRIPTLVVLGERDLPYNHAIAEALVRRAPDVTSLFLSDAGHMASMEAPEPVSAAIAELAARAFA